MIVDREENCNTVPAMVLVYPTRDLWSWDDPSEMSQVEAGPGAFLFHVAFKKKNNWRITVLLYPLKMCSFTIL